MFKSVFSQRFKDTNTDQHNIMRLQTAIQKNESPQQSANRCRALSQKIMCKTRDPVAQRIHPEKGWTNVISQFRCRFGWYPGKHVSYTGPRDIYQAVSIEIGVQEAEKQERFNESFIQNLIIRLECQRNHPVGPARMTLRLSAHMTRQRSITFVVSATNLRTALTSHQTQLPGMHRRKLKSGVISAKG